MLSLRAVSRHNGIGRTPLLRPAKCGTRHVQTATVTDNDIARLASRPLYPLTLNDLCKHGCPPLSTQQLLNSANFTLSILPTRLAHRIQSLRSLPYIVVANPNVNKIHSNYVHSLSTLLPYAERHIETVEDEVQFTEVMADLVQTHNNTIAVLAKGFLEARKYITPETITSFLDEHLRARIGTRLVAEQHITLHFSSQPHLAQRDGEQAREERPGSTYIGVIDTALRPADIIQSCEHTVGEICELKYGVRPTVRIVGELDTTIAHIPMHLEYILTELLKNSFRATIEAGMEKEAVEVTIAPAPATGMVGQDRADEAAATTTTRDASLPIPTAHQRTSTPGVTIRIRDRGGGIRPDDYTKLWEYGFTTFNEEEINEKTGGAAGMSALDVFSAAAGGAGGSSLAGLGYGLPLGRAYAEYFGGGIAVQSLYGWGTDVYLSLRGVGKT